MKNPLWKRLPRELKSDFGKYIVIFLFMTLTIGFVSGFLVADDSMLAAYDEGFEKYNIEHGNFTLSSKASESDLKKIEKNGKVRICENFYRDEATDADLDGAVEWAMIGIFFNQGEVCCAGSRIIIEESIHDAFVKRFAERANAMTIGNPLDNPDMGPVVSESQLRDVLSYVQKGLEEGATLVCGGERFTEGECAKGYFMRPTIFDHCTPDMTIVREEIFGPVVTIQTFKTEEEAIAMANDTDYGLAGGVFTHQLERAIRVVKEVRAGITWVNAFNPTFNEAPWGGYKMSGIGRELGVHGLEEYQEIKQVNINLTPGAPGWYEH